MARKPVLVVMAAGMGSRYGGLKQIEAVGNHGEAILDYSLYDAWRAGFETAVIVIKEAIRQDFMDTVGARLKNCPLEIRYAYQELTDLPAGFTVPEGREKPWGTGHAVLCAGRVVGDGPFAVINADDYYGKRAFQTVYDYLSAACDRARYDYCMVGYRLDKTVTDHGAVARGVCQVEDGKLRSIQEQTRIVKQANQIVYTEDGEHWIPLPPDTTVSMNLFGFTGSFPQELEARFPVFLSENLQTNPQRCEFYLPSVVMELLKEDKAQVEVLRSADQWYGVTYAADRAQVEAAVRRMTAEGDYPDGLWK